MGIYINVVSNRWREFHRQCNRVQCIVVFTISCMMVQLPVMAQVSKVDSLEISDITSRAHALLTKHNYADAIFLAKEALGKSTRLDFKSGIISAQLIIANAQKSLTNYSESLNHYLQALAVIQKQDDKPMLAWINLKIGELFQEWGVPEKALPYFKTALSLQSEKTNDQSAALMERIAEAHLRLNQRGQSLEMYFQILELMRQKNDVLQTKRVLEKIALIYSLSNDTENSLKYNLQILEINKQLGDPVNTASTLNVIGNHYKDLKNLEKALEYYEAALAMNQKNNAKRQSDNNIVTNLINIGTIYQARGDTRNAIRNFNDALSIKKKTGTPVEIAVMHNYLASLYLAQTNYLEAERETKESIALLSGTDNKRLLARNYKRLSEIYGMQNRYEKALVSYQIYSILKDSLLYQELLAQEKEKSKEYVIEAAEKEAKLSLIDHEMRALELRNEKEITEREKQEIELLLKEKELQNISLQNEQLEQSRAVQQLQLQRGQIEKEKQQQEILLLEQKRDLQNAEIERNELQEVERQKEIAFKNTKLELQQAQLERVGIRQQLLVYTTVLLLAIVVLILVGYVVKQRDNKKLQAQYNEINAQKAQIESINKTLVELNEEKNDLIGIVAHDLKSPLNQISGILEIMKLTAKKDQHPDEQTYAATIEQSTNRLKKMISKILDVSAIESQTLNIKLEKIKLDDLLNETVDRFVPMAKNKHITIVKAFEPGLPSIESDIGYVSEVLENLMSNAVKYSPLEKKVTIKLSMNTSFVRIEFMDEGQGISEKDMKNLFGKYHKLTARPTGGEDSTGLGLSIVKKYVQALRGKVWCESEEGRGSNFIVELPVS